jgi:hypothetical protein
VVVVPEFHNEFNAPNYGTINQAARDININQAQALAATADIRAALAHAGLSPEVTRLAVRELDDVEQEIQRPNPDNQRVAARLESLTAILKSAGALAAAGVALVGPIGVLAGLLGPLGHAVAKLVES